MFLNKIKIIKFVFFVALFLFACKSVEAAVVGDLQNFNIDKGFDISARTQIAATLIKATNNLYFYVDKTWWDAQTPAKQNAALTNLNNLSNEFVGNIYPKLTFAFGQEWNPGIDNDSRITVLFEPMNNTEGGYFREADEYGKLQVPTSNEREMVYLATSGIDDPNVKIILGHEFVHLITFNKKNRINGVEEDTWLNEARADYASTILGYDDIYSGSNLQQRVNDFAGNPLDSLINWSGTKYNYASVNLFTHYLVDHYSINVLADSLKSGLVGIESINYALKKNGFKENFAQIFTNWTIALAINDCSQNNFYCYTNKNLISLKVQPTLIFLPLTGSSSLSSTNVTRDWAGNWQKIIGGNGNLMLDFSISSEFNFRVPYVVYNKDNNYSVKFLEFDKNGNSKIGIQDFGTQYKSLIIIPTSQLNLFGSDSPGATYSYSFMVSVTGTHVQEDPVLIQKLLTQIQDLKNQIANILAQRVGDVDCQITGNLSFGMSGSQVSCLQLFLKNQGLTIYPEGLVTGNFGNLTKTAVINFQKKYGIYQTGLVGSLTRNKINSIINGG